MRAFSAVVAIAWLCDGVLAGSKSTKTCKDVACCTANEDTSLTIAFLLNFEDELPAPLCLSTQRKLALDFVTTYNFLSRLNCDKPCFRRATDARVVAAPENTFVRCNSKEPNDNRQLVVTEDRSIIIEVELEQSGICETALDGRDGKGSAAHPHDYEDACGAPAWDWKYNYPKDVCYYPDEDNESCCCACGADRSLAEADIIELHKHTHTLVNLGVKLTNVQELFSREDCSNLTVEFSAALILVFSGDTSTVSPAESDNLFETVQSCYNGLTFRNCDRLGRTIMGGDLDPLPAARRRLQGGGYANPYASNACQGSNCAGANANANANCPASVCPEEDDLNLFGEFRRRLASKQADKNASERMLGPYIPITTTSSEYILEQCLCPTHEKFSTGTAPEPRDFVTQFNVDLQSSGQFPELGVLEQAIEIEVFPSAGPPKDFEVWLPIYVKGNPCQLDVYELQALADAVQEAYNQMVFEDCDKPLFRQILSAVTWMDPHIDCRSAQFVSYVKVLFRCHGYCNPKRPVFGVYKDAYRRALEEMNLELEEQDEGGREPYDPIEYHPELKLFPSEPSSEIIQGVRRDGETGPGPDGICAIEGARNPMPPTPEGFDARINANLPSSDIFEISILTEPLCRCEGPYENFYYYSGKGSKKGPKDFHDFKTQNGIVVVPKEIEPCKYRRLGEERDLAAPSGVFPCFSY